MSSSQTVRMSVWEARQRWITLHRGQAAAGKDELVCEAAGGLLRLVGAVVDADRLQEHQAVRLEQLRAAAEEEVEVLPPDRLDHLDRDELVEAALQLAVVGVENRHSLLEARRRAPGSPRSRAARERSSSW